MAHEVSAVIGSGTVPQTYNILPSGARGVRENGAGVRTGTQVMVANFEDNYAAETFITSGVQVTSVLTEIWGPHINPLPRQRTVVIRNGGPGDLFIYPGTLNVSPSGAALPFSAEEGFQGQFKLPFMKNVAIYARSTSFSEVTILAY